MDEHLTPSPFQRARLIVPARQRLFWTSMLALFLSFILTVAAGGRLFYELECDKLLTPAQASQLVNAQTGAQIAVRPEMAALVHEDALKSIMFRLTMIFLFILALFALVLLLVAQNRSRQFTRLFETQRNMVFALADLAELRDQATGRHLERTRSYGVILAGELRKLPKYRRLVNDQFIDNIYDAAALHDIGKIGIPDQVLLKTGRLGPEEFALMQRHVEIGGQILTRIIEKMEDPVPFLVMSRNIARYHHEKYDGSGYPEGLIGEAIPLEARIYALCDAYDAIRTRRPYKEPVTHMETVQRLFADRNSHFDPDVVNAFISCEERIMELYESYQVFDEVYLQFADTRNNSGPAVVWNSEFEVGVELIDRQHRELIDRVNKLMAATREGRGREETFSLLHYLRDYVVEHFRTEEQFMLRHQHADFAAHKEMHDTFFTDLDVLVARVENDGIDSNMVVVVNQKVINWIVAHIFMVDKGLRNYVTGPLENSCRSN